MATLNIFEGKFCEILKEAQIINPEKINSNKATDSSSDNSSFKADNKLFEEDKIYFSYKGGKIFSVYKFLIVRREEDLLSNNLLITRLRKYCFKNPTWTFLLKTEDEFSYAIFKGTELLASECQHKYHEPPEIDHFQCLCLDPKDKIISNYRDAIKMKIWLGQHNYIMRRGGLIFYNDDTAHDIFLESFFKFGSGKVGADSVKIPIMVKKAHFNVAKSIYAKLTEITTYGSLSQALEDETKNVIESKSFKSKNAEDVFNDDTEPIESDLDITTRIAEDLTIKLEKPARKGKRKRNDVKKSLEKQKRDRIMDCLSSDLNLEQLKRNLSWEYPHSLITYLLDAHDNTLLHVAVMKGQKKIVQYLLDAGSDPCAKNTGLKTPYNCTEDWGVKKIFHEFALKFPRRHDYEKAEIPANVLRTEEVKQLRSARMRK